MKKTRVAVRSFERTGRVLFISEGIITSPLFQIIMTRPRSRCKIRFCIKIRQFKPEGVAACDLKRIELSPEEAEALRLRNIERLEQIAGARHMGISQSTFQRLLVSANQKVAQALFEGKAIIIREP